MEKKAVLVTGGSSGIGRAACIAFSRQGYRVAVHFNTGSERAKEVVNSILTGGGDAAAVGADLRDSEAVRGLLDSVKSRFGRLDVLVNNAGNPIGRIPFQEVDESTLEDAIATNLKAPFRVTQAALPLLTATRGTIINISSSLTAKPSFSSFSPYVAAKGGVNGLTVALASELSPLGIRVNCVCPGIIDTELQRRLSPPERLKHAAGQNLSKRIGTPEEIAEIIVFLASESAGFINGQLLFADGGR